MAEGTGILGTTKDFFTLLREGTITVLLLLFLFLPGTMRDVLVRAGFTSADIAGFKWELKKSAEQTQSASANVAQLETKLSTLNARLDQISQSTAAATEVKQQITTLAEELGRTRAQTSAVQTTLQDSLKVQKSVILRVDPKLAEQMQAGPQ